MPQSRVLPPLSRPRGYTIVELMTVIAIIAIISGIIVLSLGKVGASRQKDQTSVLLSRLNNALSEITNSSSAAQKLFTIQLPGIYFPDPAFDFPNSASKNWVGVPAGALESQARSARVIAEVLASNPAAKKIIDDLPAERRAKVTFKPPLVPVQKEYLVPLDSWGNPILFIYDNLQIATGTNVGRPFSVALGGTTNFEVGGVTNVVSDSDKSYYEPPQPLSPPPTYVTTNVTGLPFTPTAYNRATDPVTARATYIQRKGPTQQIEYTLRSPDHRPFWMSAGPDGKYETIDDNVFSFGN